MVTKEQITEWLKEYGLHHFIQYPYGPIRGMHVGHMTRYPEDLAEFLADKLRETENGR